eukprot:CAMPEP_0176439790 /NCGR_PEP_ID=MMETSP0127-20121128/20168_1 /TAXON_ID=938130 /ORGANISM="Platyophrya macrostoma, Strain WH" /LENGTH=61 /DNA_ID=CAMNT_0017824157 /DNA_START=169 /DNA_END=354 /DNA_ORIENTATION=-
MICQHLSIVVFLASWSIKEADSQEGSRNRLEEDDSIIIDFSDVLMKLSVEWHEVFGIWLVK